MNFAIVLVFKRKILYLISSINSPTLLILAKVQLSGDIRDYFNKCLVCGLSTDTSKKQLFDNAICKFLIVNVLMEIVVSVQKTAN